MRDKSPDSYEAELHENASDTRTTVELVKLAGTGAGLAQVVPTLVAHVLRKGANRKTQELIRLTNEYVQQGVLPAPGSPEEEVYEEVLFEAVRSALAADKAVLPAYARLIAEYSSGKRGVDSFFRGVARLLESLDTVSMTALERLLVAVKETRDEIPALAKEKVCVVSVSGFDKDKSGFLSIYETVFATTASVPDGASVERRFPDALRWRELLRRLANQELATEISTEDVQRWALRLNRLHRVIVGS